MNRHRRDDLRTLAVSFAVALTLSLSTVTVWATEHDETIQPNPRPPMTALESSNLDGEPATVTATDVPMKDMASAVDKPVAPGVEPNLRPLAGRWSATTTYLDHDGTIATLVRFPAEHSGTLFGKEPDVPWDVDALTTVLAEKGVPFFVTQIPLKDLFASVKLGDIAFRNASLERTSALPTPSPDCLLGRDTWSHCYGKTNEVLNWYKGIQSSWDYDTAGPPPELWKLRSLSSQLPAGASP